VSCPRNEVVAGEPTPRGEIFFDRNLGRENLEKLTGPKPIEAGAQVQQKSTSAVHVAAVEAVVRSLAMAWSRARRAEVVVQ
jgi:hypothetical protein